MTKKLFAAIAIVGLSAVFMTGCQPQEETTSTPPLADGAKPGAISHLQAPPKDRPEPAKDPGIPASPGTTK